jgi:hypothetical protein
MLGLPIRCTSSTGFLQRAVRVYANPLHKPERAVTVPHLDEHFGKKRPIQTGAPASQPASQPASTIDKTTREHQWQATARRASCDLTQQSLGRSWCGQASILARTHEQTKRDNTMRMLAHCM